MTQYRQPSQSYAPRREQQQPTLPAGYLQGGYFDEKGNIKCDLLANIAEQVAKVLGDSGVTSTQLRGFFMQVRAIERRLGQTSFPEVVPQIQKLKPLAANYVGRAKNEAERRGRPNLKLFIDRNGELAVRDEKNFKKGFIPHFESVVAYYKYHFPSK